MPTPSKRSLIMAASAAVLFLAGSNIQSGWLYVLGAFLVGTAVAGMLIASSVVRRVEVTRKARPQATVGEPVDIGLVVEASRGGGLLEITDTFIEPTRIFVERMDGRATVTYQVVPRRRGRKSLGAVEVSSGFPIGAAVAKRRLAVRTDMIIHPRWHEVASFPLLEAASVPNEAVHDRRRSASGMEFFGVREHRAGDSIRHIHWPSSARTTRLMIREFEDPPTSRLGIFIDATKSAGLEPVTTFEDSVSVSASLALYALDSGHPVQLFVDGPKGINRIFEPTRLEMLDLLSSIEADGRRGLDELVAESVASISSRSTNVLIFPTLKESADSAMKAANHLQALGTRAIAVAVSARSYDQRLGMTESQEEELIARLAAARVLVYQVGRDRTLQEALREPVRI